jgi:hypothetical protein
VKKDQKGSQQHEHREQQGDHERGRN